MWNHSLLEWEEQGVGGDGREGLKKSKREVEEKGLKLSITEGEKEGKSKVIASCRYLKERFQECSIREGVVVATSVETLGEDLRTKTKQLGVKERLRRKKCDVRLFAHQENIIFQKSYMSIGMRKLLRTGLVPARAWRCQPVGMAPTEKAQVGETNGSSSRQEGIVFALTLYESE